MIEKNLEKKLENFLKSNAPKEKKRSKGNWKQRLVTRRFSLLGESFKQKPLFNNNLAGKKKSLLYLFFLNKMVKNYGGKVTYLNLQLLKIFLTRYAKIKARRKTKLPVSIQKQIAKSIRRARVEGLLPFTTKVILQKPLKKRKISSKVVLNN